MATPASPQENYLESLPSEVTARIITFLATHLSSEALSLSETSPKFLQLVTGCLNHTLRPRFEEHATRWASLNPDIHSIDTTFLSYDPVPVKRLLSLPSLCEATVLASAEQISAIGASVKQLSIVVYPYTREPFVEALLKALEKLDLVSLAIVYDFDDDDVDDDDDSDDSDDTFDPKPYESILNNSNFLQISKLCSSLRDLDAQSAYADGDFKEILSLFPSLQSVTLRKTITDALAEYARTMKEVKIEKARCGVERAGGVGASVVRLCSGVPTTASALHGLVASQNLRSLALCLAPGAEAGLQGIASSLEELTLCWEFQRTNVRHRYGFYRVPNGNLISIVQAAPRLSKFRLYEAHIPLEELETCLQVLGKRLVSFNVWLRDWVDLATREVQEMHIRLARLVEAACLYNPDVRDFMTELRTEDIEYWDSDRQRVRGGIRGIDDLDEEQRRRVWTAVRRLHLCAPRVDYQALEDFTSALIGEEGR